jgi:hypothetical protein
MRGWRQCHQMGCPKVYLNNFPCSRIETTVLPVQGAKYRKVVLVMEACPCCLSLRVFLYHFDGFGKSHPDASRYCGYIPISLSLHGIWYTRCTSCCSYFWWPWRRKKVMLSSILDDNGVASSFLGPVSALVAQY